MKCPGCGAAVSKTMIAEGECGYCHTVLPKSEAGELAEAIERLAKQQPKVVHVTKVELPDLQAGRLFDSVTARLAGCFSGCLSAGITIGITAMIMGFVAWQLYISSRSMPSPSPSPSPAPVGDHPRKEKRR